MRAQRRHMHAMGAERALARRGTVVVGGPNGPPPACAGNAAVLALHLQPSPAPAFFLSRSTMHVPTLSIHAIHPRWLGRLLDDVPEEEPDMRQGNGSRDEKANEFTLRAVVAGLAIGTLLCGSNMHFGLQTGGGLPVCLTPAVGHTGDCKYLSAILLERFRRRLKCSMD